jgi:hypothetical protein
MPAPRLARWAGPLRIEEVCPGRNPAAIRQPVLAPGDPVAVRHLTLQAAVSCAAVRRAGASYAAVRRAGARYAAVRHGAVRHAESRAEGWGETRAEARAEIRGEAAWRADGLVGRFAGRLQPGWHVTGVPHGWTESVSLGLAASAWSGSFVLLVRREGG